jgi:general secretion pathway protein G
LVAGVVDAKSPSKDKKIYFLRRIPRDPLNQVLEGGVPNWGLRSYASPAADPQPGADIFDVYSLSPAIGLNGTPYKEW